MDEDLLAAAQVYVRRHGLKLAQSLGSGIDGMVWRLKSQIDPFDTALKIHRKTAAFWRELRCYERLREKLVFDVQRFVVPSLVRAEADLLVVEMTAVSSPFLLDFATAYLEAPPDFSEEAWEYWEREKAEQFGERWETVAALLDQLKIWGIYMLDPSPNNIRFD